MLARFQQVLTLGAVGAALLWAALMVHNGRPGWALAGVVAVIAGPACILALEFFLLWRVHGDDPTPRATPRQLLRAWWGEVRATPLVFCWRQPFRSQRWPDHLPTAAQGRRGVLLVHGYVCNRGIWNRWLQRLTEMDVPVVAVNLEPVFGPIDDMVPGIEAAVRRLQAHTGVPPLVVAHSMGGLVLRHWWTAQVGDARVQHAITIGTPHRGTWLARLGRSAGARQMRQQSAWLDAMVKVELPLRASRFTCFYSHCDNIVFPAVAATLAGADNRHLDGVAHVHMVDRAEPWDELVSRLKAAPTPDSLTPPPPPPMPGPK
ncbi:MAG: alpha/beta hydrolase, partial [Rubrivivax sp.]